MTNQQSHLDGSLSDAELNWLLPRAAGGFGVIESCATHVSLDGQGWEGEWGVFADAHIDDWKRATQAINSEGAHLYAQLYHGGARSVRVNGNQPWSASASGEGDNHVTAGTEDDIQRTIDAFAASARRVAEAGAQGVELHGAHGYLLCQFLSSDTNQRDDKWGGSLENRARLVRQCVQAVRASVSSTFTVGIRLSPENWGQLKGLDLDESIQTAKWLCEDGADFIHISLWDSSNNSTKRPEEHPAAAFRAALPANVPIVTAGNIWTVDEAAGQLSHGAGAVALGRSGIVNPAWPQRVLQGNEEPVRTPVTSQYLLECGLSESFVRYMARWKGFVAE
jgi:2,4-dienoyl-CoA reductase-like NADH-dependent reductase (Old Yellow Enzyme family)